MFWDIRVGTSTDNSTHDTPLSEILQRMSFSCAKSIHPHSNSPKTYPIATLILNLKSNLNIIYICCGCGSRYDWCCIKIPVQFWICNIRRAIIYNQNTTVGQAEPRKTPTFQKGEIKEEQEHGSQESTKPSRKSNYISKLKKILHGSMLCFPEPLGWWPWLSGPLK